MNQCTNVVLVHFFVQILACLHIPHYITFFVKIEKSTY